MTETDRDGPAGLFLDPVRWSDMGQWHEDAAQVRAETPVLECAVDGYRPFWALTRHEDVFAVSRDNDRWLNTPRSVLGREADYQALVDSPMPPPATLVHLDGQEHRDHRAVTNHWFKPAAVEKRQPRVGDLAEEYIDKMRTMGGECDFARDIAQPYTLRVIMDIYGVPESDEDLMLELTQGIFGASDPEYLGDDDDPTAKVLDSVLRFVEYFDAMTKDRQACPADDLASLIANGEIDGCPLGDEQRLWYYIIVATAGHDTTSFALAGGLEAMVADPDQLWALRDDPDLIVNATDECIRWTSPVRHFLRYPTEATEVGGVTIPADSRVLVSYPSANRDAAVFDDPMRFDVRRPDADRLISFGVGAHFCLGVHFAKRELRTMLGRLSQELTHIEPAGEVEWSQSHFVSGVKHLPIAYSMR